ncbi:hypothetical protein HY857_01090 [Candidatus Saccharibacteria bacterium]|nr:hypothetical protein [Candidatus Saccharibacteria bacterium]
MSDYQPREPKREPGSMPPEESVPARDLFLDPGTMADVLGALRAVAHDEQLSIIVGGEVDPTSDNLGPIAQEMLKLISEGDQETVLRIAEMERHQGRLEMLSIAFKAVVALARTSEE